MPVKVSHNIDLGPELPNEVMDIARKQGEDPDRVVADIQELRDMIFGKYLKRFSFDSCGFHSMYHSKLTHSKIALINFQKEEFVCHLALMMISLSVSCVHASSKSKRLITW